MTERYVGPVIQSAKAYSVYQSEDKPTIDTKGQDISIPRDPILEAKEDADVAFAFLKFNVKAPIGEYRESPLFGDYKIYSLALQDRIARREANLFPVAHEYEDTEAEHHDPIPLIMVENGVTEIEINNMISYPSRVGSGQVFNTEQPEANVETALYYLVDIPRPIVNPYKDTEDYVQITGNVTVHSSYAFTPTPNSVYFSGTITDGILGLTTSEVDDPYERAYGVDVFQGEGSYTVFDIEYGGDYVLNLNIPTTEISVITSDDTIFIGNYSGPIELNGFLHSRYFISMSPTINGTWSLTYIQPSIGYSNQIVDPEFEAIVKVRLETGEADYPYADDIPNATSHEFKQIMPLNNTGWHTFPINFVVKTFTGKWLFEDSINSGYPYPDYSTAGWLRFHISCDTLPLDYAVINYHVETLGQEFHTQEF